MAAGNFPQECVFAVLGDDNRSIQNATDFLGSCGTCPETQRNSHCLSGSFYVQMRHMRNLMFDIADSQKAQLFGCPVDGRVMFLRSERKRPNNLDHRQGGPDAPVQA